MIRRVPAADVRPVVLCRDCAVPHNGWTGCQKMNGTIVFDEDFCSHGVREPVSDSKCLEKEGAGVSPEERRELLRAAESMEDGMLKTGAAFKQPVDKTMRERILWALCKAFYDVILFILKHDKVG